MLYQAQMDGFTGHFNNLSELRVWADRLHREYGMMGKTCNIWKAHWVAKDGSGAAYRGAPHQVVYGA
jgi:hypothetical protein